MKNIPTFALIIVVILALFLITYQSCEADKKISVLQDEYKAKTAPMKEEIVLLQQEKLKRDEEIKKLLDDSQEKDIELEEKGKEIDKLKSKILNIKPVVITDENCKQEYQELYADYLRRGELIDKQDAQLKLFQAQVDEQKIIIKKQFQQIEGQEKAIKNYEIQLALSEKLTKDIIKVRRPLFVFGIGGYAGTSGLGAGLFIGVDLGAAFGRIFK